MYNLVVRNDAVKAPEHIISLVEVQTDLLVLGAAGLANCFSKNTVLKSQNGEIENYFTNLNANGNYLQE